MYIHDEKRLCEMAGHNIYTEFLRCKKENRRTLHYSAQLNSFYGFDAYVIHHVIHLVLLLHF